jgi:hypothetical protein
VPTLGTRRESAVCSEELYISNPASSSMDCMVSLVVVRTCSTVTDCWMVDTSTLVGGGDREKSTSFIVRTQLQKKNQHQQRRKLQVMIHYTCRSEDSIQGWWWCPEPEFLVSSSEKTAEETLFNRMNCEIIRWCAALQLGAYI